MKRIVFLIVLSFLFLFSYSKTYYVDQIKGNDHNKGYSLEKAWQSLNNVNLVEFYPGDSILFKRGGEWIGFLRPKGKGVKNRRIVIAAYGLGEAPIIDARGQKEKSDLMSATILLFNQEYWEFRDIEVSNFEHGNHEKLVQKAGILVIAKDIGTLHDLKFENLKISNINGSLKTRENGGIFLNVIADSIPERRVPTNFDGVYINQCYFLDIDRGGFLNQSFWRKRDIKTKFGEIYCDSLVNNWFSSYNIIIENCKFENIGGNGLVTRVAESPLVQNNLFVRCSCKTTGNASYPYNCNNALWQFNEACFTVYNEGDVDASGFDSDYLCKNTILQYNYSHHNEWGGLLVCSWAKVNGSFNDGTIVRNNVFQDEKHHLIRFSGNITNTEISDNLFISDITIDYAMLWYKEWGEIWPDHTVISNNIFFNNGGKKLLILGETTNNTIIKNYLAGSSFTDFSDFIPIQNSQELMSKIRKIKDVGERDDLANSKAREVSEIIRGK